MKKILFSFFFVLIAANLMAETYNEHDKSKLEAFLKQDSGIDGEKNWKQLGLATEPDWTTDDWVPDVSNVVWNGSTNRIAALEWSGKPIAGELDLSGTDILKLEVNSTKISKLNLNGLTNLQTLNCADAELSELDINGLTSLETLDCANNSLTFATLPPVNAALTSYTYVPQKPIIGSMHKIGIINLSKHLHNEKTVFKWYDKGNNELDDIRELTDGRFHIPDTYTGKDLECKMTNEDFPDSENYPLTYIVDPTYLYNETDKSKLKAFLQQENTEGKKNWQVLGYQTEPDWVNDNQWPLKWGSVSTNGIVWQEARIVDIEIWLSSMGGMFDISGMTELTSMDYSMSYVEGIKARGATKLKYLICSANPNLSEITLDDLPNLETLSCSQTSLSELDLSGVANLKSIACDNSCFTFATLPPVSNNYTTYTYAPQKPIDGGMSTDGVIDLTKHLHNNKTVFKWYDSRYNELNDIAGENGIFTIPKAHAGKTLICRMTNEDFPDFENKPLTYTVDISATLSIGDNISDDNEKVYASGNTLYIQTQQKGSLIVTDLSGKVYVNSEIQPGTTNIALEKGLYIATFGGKKNKIVISD